MLDSYKQRLLSQGSYIGEVVKKNSDMIMDATFVNDVACKKCYIDSQLFYAKFQKYTPYTLNKDIVDYRLQFQTGVHVPVGTYIDIPDDTNTYHTWLIVGRDDDTQFVKYLVLKCNWTFKWIYNSQIYTCLGILPGDNNAGESTASDHVITTAAGDLSFWVPTTSNTQTITYDMRFLITQNLIHPLVYKVIGMKETSPIGILKVSLIKNQYDPNADNLELMIADYYKSTIEPTQIAISPVLGTTSRITCNGTSSTLKIGGSYKTLTAVFYNANGDVIDIVNPIWNFVYPTGKENKFEVINTDSNSQKQIRALKDYDLIGQIVTIQVQDSNGNNSSIINLEVVVI